VIDSGEVRSRSVVRSNRIPDFVFFFGSAGVVFEDVVEVNEADRMDDVTEGGGKRMDG